MPAPGKHWWHLILSTHGSWLPGDPRGFRSRGHRVHSSGDYKHRPPPGEHARLHDYQQRRAVDAVVLPVDVRRRVGAALLDKLDEMKAQTLIVAVAAMHVHMVVELDDDYEGAKRTAGRLKQRASHVIGDSLPGRVWAAGNKPVRVSDRAHLAEAYDYILRHAGKGAWVWTFKEGAN